MCHNAYILSMQSGRTRVGIQIYKWGTGVIEGVQINQPQHCSCVPWAANASETNRMRIFDIQVQGKCDLSSALSCCFQNMVF